MNNRNIHIAGTGKFFPELQLTQQFFSEKLGVDVDWLENNVGLTYRYHVQNETASQMGAAAIRSALQNANMHLKEIECIICCSATMEQIIPCTASLILHQLDQHINTIACFDINSSCLSFITAMDIISYLIEAGRFQNVILVSSEIASVGLNWEDKKSCALFSDGAAAVILKRSENNTSKIIASKLTTYAEGVHLTEIKGGGSKLPPTKYNKINHDDYLFYMDGEGIFKLAATHMPAFIHDLLNEAQLTLDDIKLIIPHQASLLAMKLLARSLKIPEEKVQITIREFGNSIAASIPMALDEAIKQNKIERGDKIILLGTSAGFSLGGVILEY